MVLDSPTNNFATLNPLDVPYEGTLSEGNLEWLGGASQWNDVFGSMAVSSGKWYFEVSIASRYDAIYLGISDADSANGSVVGTYSSSCSYTYAGDFFLNTAPAYATGKAVHIPQVILLELR